MVRVYGVEEGDWICHRWLDFISGWDLTASVFVYDSRGIKMILRDTTFSASAKRNTWELTRSDLVMHVLYQVTFPIFVCMCTCSIK